jgi:hypothetical protein
MGWPATLGSEGEVGGSEVLERNETEMGELICLIFGRIQCYRVYLGLCNCMMWQILIKCCKRCLLQIIRS